MHHAYLCSCLMACAHTFEGSFVITVRTLHVHRTSDSLRGVLSYVASKFLATANVWVLVTYCKSMLERGMDSHVLHCVAIFAFFKLSHHVRNIQASALLRAIMNENEAGRQSYTLFDQHKHDFTRMKLHEFNIFSYQTRRPAIKSCSAGSRNSTRAKSGRDCKTELCSNKGSSNKMNEINPQDERWRILTRWKFMIHYDRCWKSVKVFER